MTDNEIKLQITLELLKKYDVNSLADASAFAGLVNRIYQKIFEDNK